MTLAWSDGHGVGSRVRNRTIRRCGQYGIWLGYDAQLDADAEPSNGFAGNAVGDVVLRP